MGDCRNLRPKIQPYRMTAIFSRSFFVPVPGRSYFQPHRAIPPAQSTTANLCADSSCIRNPIPQFSAASVVCVDSQYRYPALIPARIHRSDLCADCRILPFLAAFHTPPLAEPMPLLPCGSLRIRFGDIQKNIRKRNSQRGQRACQTDRLRGSADRRPIPFPVSGGCGEGRKSATFSAPRCVACWGGVNRPHPVRSPAGDYSATSLSVRLRELIVR